MQNQLRGIVGACWMALAGLAFLAPAQCSAQVPPAPGSPVVTVTRVQLVPKDPPVGTDYKVVLEVYTREAGVVRARIQVPNLDRVTNTNPQDQFIPAGQRLTYVFTVRCGVPGGDVLYQVDMKR